LESEIEPETIRTNNRARLSLIGEEWRGFVSWSLPSATTIALPGGTRLRGADELLRSCLDVCVLL
jgi:hypothetical protein